jgi:putative membrane protein
MTASEGEWTMLHPASVGVNLLPRAWRLLRAMWPLALVLLWRGWDDDSAMLSVGFADASIVGAFFLLSGGSTLWHWLTLRFRIHEERLEIRTGWLHKQVRTIDPRRIQNVELIANPIHRVAGLVELRIETASGFEVEGLLSALSTNTAEDLRAHLVRLREADLPEDTETAPAVLLVYNGPWELFAHGATAVRFGGAIVVAGIGFEIVAWLAPDQIGEVMFSLAGLQGIALMLALMCGAWLTGIAGTMALHWGLSLARTDDALTLEAGLFTRRRLELSMRKIQIVATSETLPRRWLKFGSLTIETAAPRSEGGGTERRAALVPHVRAEDLPRLARAAIPDLDIDPWEARLTPPPRRALVRALTQRTVFILTATTLLGTMVTPWAWGGALLLVPILTAEWLDHRVQGWAVSSRALIVRRGFVDRRFIVVARRRVQSAHLVQGPIMRRLNLARLIVRVAGTGIAFLLMTMARAEELLTELTRMMPSPTWQEAACVS